MRDLVLLTTILGLIPFILKRPWIGVLAWFWVGLMAPHGLTWGFMKTAPVAMIIGVATLFALLFTKERATMPVTREMALMFLFAAFTALTSWAAMVPDQAWEQWRHVMKVLLMTFVTPILVFGQKRILWLLLIVTVSIGFYGMKGGVFAILTGGAHMVLGPPGTFLAGNTFIGLAMIMVLPLILVTARLFRQKLADIGWPLRAEWYPLIGLGFYATFWLTVVAILATYSRGALVGLLAITPFLFLRMKRKTLMTLIALLAVGVVGVSAPDQLVERWGTIKTYEEDQSAMQRVQAWGVNWNMAVERPFLGMGFRNTWMGYDWWISYANFEGSWRHVLSPHSIYFQVLGQHGFAGLSIFLALIAFTYRTLGRIKRRASELAGRLWLSQYAWAIQVGLIGYLVAGAFLDVAYFNLLYAFIALAIIMRRELDDSLLDRQVSHVAGDSVSRNRSLANGKL